MKRILLTWAALLATVSMWASDKGKTTWPEEWRNVKYAKQEVLPDARISKGEAVVKVRLLNYNPSKKLELMVGVQLLLRGERFHHRNYRRQQLFFRHPVQVCSLHRFLTKG